MDTECHIAKVASLGLLVVTMGCEVYGVIGINTGGAGTDGTTENPGGGDTEDTDDTADSGASGTTGTILDVGDDRPLPSYGEKWCAFAKYATYTPDPNPGQDDAVLDKNGNPPEGCQCLAFNTALHDWILENEMNDEVVIEQSALEQELGAGTALVDDLLEFRDDIYDETRLSCLETVPPANLGHTCSAPDLFDEVPQTPDFEPTPLHRGAVDGSIDCTPVPEGLLPSCDFGDDTAGVSVIGTTFEIDADIVDGFLNEPTCLMRAGWSVGLAGDGDFELRGVTPEDMLDVLGFENGDQFTTITAGGDRFSVETAPGALAALVALQTETSFTVDVIRNGSTVTQSYRIVP